MRKVAITIINFLNIPMMIDTIALIVERIISFI